MVWNNYKRMLQLSITIRKGGGSRVGRKLGEKGNIVFRRKNLDSRTDISPM